MKREPKRNRCNLQYRSWNGLDHSAAIGKSFGSRRPDCPFSEEEAERRELNQYFAIFTTIPLKIFDHKHR